MESGFLEIIGGVIVGGSITAAAGPLRDFLLGPRLRVLYHAGEFGKVKTTEHHRHQAHCATAATAPGEAGQEVDITLSYFTREVVYVRLRVDNAWRGTLKNCRAFLVDIEREMGDQKRERVFFDSIPLSWSNIVDSSSLGRLDIPAGVIFNLDVLSTRKGSDAYLPRLAAVPNYYESLFKQHGTFRWTIAVTADNAKPFICKLRLKWSGIWDDFDVEEIPDRDW